MPREPQDDTLHQLIEHAATCVTSVLQTHAIKKSELPTTNLSKATIDRRLNSANHSRYDDATKWLRELVPIYKRTNDIVVEKGSPPLSWAQFFGDEFPLPPHDVSFAALSRARFSDRRLLEAASPLVSHLTNAYEASKNKGNVWKLGQVLSNLCHTLELTENWPEASRYFAALAKLNERTGDFHFRADALLRQGQALYFCGRLSEAEVSLRAGLSVIDDHEAPPYRTKLRLLNYLAMVKSDLSEHETAEKILLEQCLPLAEAKCSHAAVASVHNRLGIILLKMGRQEAERHLISALVARTDMNMISEASKTLFLLGRTHRTNGLLKQAILLWEVAIRLQLQHDDFEILGETQFECGCAYADYPESQFPLTVTCSPVNFPNRELRRPLDRLRELAEIDEVSVSRARDGLRRAHERLLSSAYHSKDDQAAARVTSKITEVVARLDATTG